jgi:hypothetical protein
VDPEQVLTVPFPLMELTEEVRKSMELTTVRWEPSDGKAMMFKIFDFAKTMQAIEEASR